MAIADRVKGPIGGWDLGRYREVLTVLMRFGLSSFVENLGRGKITGTIRPNALRAALCELGPVFIKLGQILATRDELLSSGFREELAKLQDNTPPSPYDQVKGSLEDELKSDIDDLFAELDSTPLASGSIGQVHRGRLPDGAEIVVKVQRPGVEGVLRRDAAIIRHLTETLGDEPHMGDHAARIVAEFLAMMESEIDYEREADHLERFAWQFEHDPDVRVPQVIRACTTKRVLTMTYVSGVKLSQLATAGVVFDRASCARRLANNYLKQVFAFGYFHADPHPGNIFVGADQSIGFYDLGLTGELTRSEREFLAALLFSLLNQDGNAAVQVLLSLAPEPRELDIERLRADISRLMTTYFRDFSSGTPVGSLLRDMLRITARHKFTLAPNLYLAFKGLATAERVIRMVDPQADLLAIAMPVLERAKPSGPARQVEATHLFELGVEALTQFRGVPAAVRGALAQLGAGNLRVQFEHRGLEPALACYERATSRLTSALIASAFGLGMLVIVGFALQSRLLTLREAGVTCIGVLLACLLLIPALSRFMLARAARERKD